MKLFASIAFLLSVSLSFAQTNTYFIEMNKLLKKGYKHYYTNKDSVFYYLDSAKKLSKKNKDIGNFIKTSNIESWSASFFGDLVKVEKNIKLLDSIFKNYKTEISGLKNKDYLTIQTTYTKALYYAELNSITKARHYFNKILKISNSIDKENLNKTTLRLIFDTNYNLAAVFNKEGKYSLADTYYKNNIRLIGDNPKFQNQLYNSQIKLSENLKKQGEYVASNQYILKSLPYYFKTNNTNRIQNSYASIVDNYLQLNKIDSAKVYVRKMAESLPKEHPFWYEYHIVNANVLQKENKTDKALNELNKALALAKAQWKQQPHKKVATTYLKIGEFQAQANLLEASLDNYNKAINEIKNTNIHSTLNKTLLFKILKNKAQAQSNLHNYKNTLLTTNQAIAILDTLKPSFKNNTDKLFLIENAFPAFENGINALYNLYKQENDTQLINQAFELSEKSKSVLLLESLLATKATDFANIPQELTAQEQQLKATITQLEKRIHKKPTNELKNQLFEANKSYQNLLENIESNYKNYYNLKYNTQTVRLEQVQKKLNNDEALLSYFFGNNALFAIVITKNNAEFHRIENIKRLQKNIEQYTQLIKTPSSNIQEVTNIGNTLYKTLLKPLNLDKNLTKYTVIADGLLNYIPFESLSLQANKQDYLVHHASVRYVNSVTLLEQLKTHQKSAKLLAFAPIFSGETISTERNKLLPLPHNTQEVENISTFFSGKTYTNDQATLQNFVQDMSNYNVLHLATHAVFNDAQPTFSYLAFSKDTNNEQLLYVNDLYNTQLNADLVTLSACETGIGELKRGEGFLSLARSFFYAGASSIVSTLWNINDASSAQIMTDFYKYLSEEKPKNVALQQAKIDFLNANAQTKLTHPYYWSAFVLSGKNTRISKTNYLPYVAIGALIIGFLLYSNRKKLV